MEFVHVSTYGNYIDANIALKMLQDNGINCHLLDENATTLIDMFGGMRLMVHHTQAKRALELLNNAHAEYLKTVPCPNCRSHSLEIIHETITTGHLLPRFILFLKRIFSKEGNTLQVKHYRCGNCYKVFKELPG